MMLVMICLKGRSTSIQNYEETKFVVDLNMCGAFLWKGTENKELYNYSMDSYLLVDARANKLHVRMNELFCGHI